MKVLYIRTSTIEQNSIRQKQNKDETCKIIEDKCSGAIPFFEREGGKKILELTEKGVVDEIIVHEIDRLGRNLLDILKTIAFFNTKKVNIEFKKQGL
jgi:DNA invertase Pin-like site-specific DNA recombinase